jgi:hypothetical protein
VKKSTLQAKAWAGFLLAALGLMTTLSARASPMTYSATVVTDIRVGTHLYHNAAVTVTFEGDSKDIVEATDSHGNPIPSTFCKTPSTTGWFYLLPKGTARVSVESQGHRLSAHLQPDQIFVASDQCNGGIGFGSFVGPNGLEPAYPLAFVLGTAASDAATSGSPLSSPANMSGYAWSCLGYPPNGAGALKGNGFCTPPDNYPLQSDLGEIVFYLPYTDINTDGSICCNHYGTLNFGTFSVRPRSTDE